jgi:hypothetical protein
MKVGKAKHKIQILGDSHAKGLANELKYKLTSDYKIQGLTKPVSKFGKHHFIRTKDHNKE